MKKLIYGAMALAMGMFIYSCEKGDDNNISSGEKK